MFFRWSSDTILSPDHCPIVSISCLIVSIFSVYFFCSASITTWIHLLILKFGLLYCALATWYRMVSYDVTRFWYILLCRLTNLLWNDIITILHIIYAIPMIIIISACGSARQVLLANMWIICPRKNMSCSIIVFRVCIILWISDKKWFLLFIYFNYLIFFDYDWNKISSKDWNFLIDTIFISCFLFVYISCGGKS